MGITVWFRGSGVALSMLLSKTVFTMRFPVIDPGPNCGVRSSIVVSGFLNDLRAAIAAIIQISIILPPLESTRRTSHVIAHTCSPW